MMQVGGDGGGDDDGDEDDTDGASQYKRYKLSEEKTFGSLFFPQKGRLLHLLQHFTDRTGASPGTQTQHITLVVLYELVS